jgi:hypothetical protein
MQEYIAVIGLSFSLTRAFAHVAPGAKPCRIEGCPKKSKVLAGQIQRGRRGSCEPVMNTHNTVCVYLLRSSRLINPLSRLIVRSDHPFGRRRSGKVIRNTKGRQSVGRFVCEEAFGGGKIRAAGERVAHSGDSAARSAEAPVPSSDPPVRALPAQAVAHAGYTKKIPGMGRGPGRIHAIIGAINRRVIRYFRGSRLPSSLPAAG